MKDEKDTLLTLTDDQIVTRRTALGIAAAVGATALIATPAWADDTESDADGEEEENDSSAGDNETDGEDEEEEEEEADADGG